MSRLPKFRAWDKNRNKMNEVIMLNFVLEVADIAGRVKPVYFENLELMQFTGLTDSKGVEIYEGDILKQKVVYNGEATDEFYKVVWRDGYGEFSFQSLGNVDEVTPCFEHDLVEVIGNVHETPELLK